jgi:hypothetical protein
MIKEYEHIHFLLNKYWNCETSLEEEKKLQDFFSQEDIPEDLQPYIPLFRDYKESQHSIRLDDDFEKKLKAAIHQKEKAKQYITIRIFAPVLKIAASIAIIVSLGAGIYFLVNENRKPYFAETYNDPKAALKDATYALEKLSEALRKGEEASKETFDKLKNLNINWAAIDSMGRDMEQEMEMEMETEVEGDTDVDIDRDKETHVNQNL